MRWSPSSVDGSPEGRRAGQRRVLRQSPPVSRAAVPAPLELGDPGVVGVQGPRLGDELRRLLVLAAVERLARLVQEAA